MFQTFPDIGNSPCEEGKETNPKLSRSSEMNPSSLAARAPRPQAGAAQLPKPWEAARHSVRPSLTAVSGHKATCDHTAGIQLNTGPEARPGARWGKGCQDPWMQPRRGEHRTAVNFRSRPSPGESSRASPMSGNGTFGACEQKTAAFGYLGPAALLSQGLVRSST